jgi:hypothetical protein
VTLPATANLTSKIDAPGRAELADAPELGLRTIDFKTVGSRPKMDSPQRKEDLGDPSFEEQTQPSGVIRRHRG